MGWGFRMAVAAAFAAALGAATPGAVAGPLVDRPLVIAHRGASQYLPEHTMEAYRLAVQMGADFIEPDLFITADGVAVARHDQALNATTNVVSVAAGNPALFAKGTPIAGGLLGRNYNVNNLTYADIQLLSAVSRGGAAYATPATSPYYDGTESFAVPTFTEVLDYVYGLYQVDGRIIGVYPEVKTIGSGLNTYNRAVADAMLAALNDPRYGGFFDGQRNNVFLQSFDPAVIQYLNTLTDLPLVFLTGTCPTAAQAQSIAAFADGVGVSNGASLNQACVDRVHDAGLLIHVYTLSNANPAAHGTVYALGVDGIFSNAPDTARGFRDELYPLQVAAVPAPAAAALLLFGVLGLAAVRRRA